MLSTWLCGAQAGSPSTSQPIASHNWRAHRDSSHWGKPFLTAFSDQDPITRGAERLLQKLIPGAAGREHPTIAGGGHFLQEDCGEALARVVINFLPS